MQREASPGTSLLLVAAGSLSRGSLLTFGESTEDELTLLPNDPEADTTASTIPGDSTDANDLSSPIIKDDEGSGFTESPVTFEVSTPENGSSDRDDTDIQSILMFTIPALAVILLIVIIVIIIVKCRQRKTLKPDTADAEDIKSPIFEEDLPSVVEIEMEELDQWMNSFNAGCEKRSGEDGEKKIDNQLKWPG